MTLQTRKDWAIDQGLATAGRGRMSKEAVLAIEAAMSKGMQFSDQDKHVFQKDRTRVVGGTKATTRKTTRKAAATAGKAATSKASRTLAKAQQDTDAAVSSIATDYPRVHPEGSEWSYKADDGKEHNPGNKAVCTQCHNSLGYCGCDIPKVLVFPFGIMPVRKIK